jgi:succinyl-diaminopimelate desuccinylase
MTDPKHNPKPIDALALAQDLVRCPSVTPEDAGTLDLLNAALDGMGFTCYRLPFSSGDEDAIDNLYARLGKGAPNFCFAGHVDVVPPGNETAWTFPPFSGRLSGGFLKGRGAADMKGAIAAYVAALSRFLPKNREALKGSLSLLITGDEEGRAKNGTRRVLEWMKEKGETLDLCLLGEPTNPGAIGEMIKIGRRGSLNVTLTVEGRQTHVAYPERGANPIPGLNKILDALMRWKINEGTDAFQPSNLEITNLAAGAGVFNVIPASATAKLNVRYNDRHTAESLIAAIEARCEKTGVPHTLGFDPIGEAFVTSSLALAETVKAAVKEVLGMDAEFSTTGGSSDARFIKDVCPVAEFGLSGATMHAIDEKVPVKDIEALGRVYERILEKIAL